MGEELEPKPGVQSDEAPIETTIKDLEAVRRQREHIKSLDGEDPLRGGVAD